MNAELAKKLGYEDLKDLMGFFRNRMQIVSDFIKRVLTTAMIRVTIDEDLKRGLLAKKLIDDLLRGETKTSDEFASNDEIVCDHLVDEEYEQRYPDDEFDDEPVGLLRFG